MKIIRIITMAVLFLGIASTASAFTYGIDLRVAASDNSGIIQDSLVSSMLTLGTRSVDGITGTVPNEVYHSGSAYANLATGQLRASTVGPPGSSTAFARWDDTLRFDMTGLPSLSIGIEAQVDGTFSLGTQPNFILDLQEVTTYSDQLLASVGYRTNQLNDTTDSPEIFLNFGEIGDFSVFGPDSFIGSLTLPGDAIVDVNVNMRLSTDGNANFGNTATFFLDSPIRFTSASGVFLSEQSIDPNPVPIPASIILLGTGLAGLVGTRSRKKRKLL